MSIEEIIANSQVFDTKNKDLIKNDGVVFTNSSECKKIISLIKPNIDEKICEPSVGKGSFIFILLEYFIENGSSIEDVLYFVENNLFCYDINKEFIQTFKQLINEYFHVYGLDSNLKLDNIICGDFLLSDEHYDVIFGNPPYVRIQNIPSYKLNQYKTKLKSIEFGNIDLYFAFIEKSLKFSKRFSFIIPNSFIKSKSGKQLRNMILDNLSYIYNFDNNKVWKSISTYTCIILCVNDTISDFIEYEEDSYKINMCKNELNVDSWLFKPIKKGSINFGDYFNYIGGGLATLRDKSFIIDSYDDLYCYKSSYKIEKDICFEFIKATKYDKNVKKYIIYPYNNNGIIDEETLQNKYPFCYEYLLTQKDILNKRDKGKVEKYDSWYAYGRKQGLYKSPCGIRMLLPLTFLKSKGLYIIDDCDNCVMTSGIFVDVKKENYNLVKDVLNSDNFYNYLNIVNKTFKDKDDVWLFINTTSIKKYTFDL